MSADYAGALSASSDGGLIVAAVRKDSATALASADGKFSPLQVNSDGALRVDASISLSASDIQIGAVEIKNGSDDTRAVVSTAGADDVSNTQNGLETYARLSQYDGTTWDRVRGTSTDGLLVNLGSNNDVTVTGSLTSAGNVTNAGTFVVQENGAALTALQLIDDPVATLGTTTYTEATTKGLTIGVVRRDADTTLVNTTNEIGPLQMDANGRLKVEAFSGEALPVTLTSTTVTGTVAVTQSGAWDEVGINDSGNSITVDNTQLSVVGSGTEAAAQRVTIATDSTGVLSVDDNGSSLTVDNGGTFAVQDATAQASLSVMDDWDNGASDGASVSGDVAHDTADAGEPVKIGMKAVALKANPTEVAANDRTNWYADVSGIPFVLGGHMNTLSQNLTVTDADGAQTDTAIITAAANVAIVVTAIEVTADNANTGDVGVRIGFGTANTPAQDAAQVILNHTGIAPGSGIVKGDGGGILGIGASNEDLRVTCEDPAGGNLSITVTYFTTEIA